MNAAQSDFLPKSAVWKGGKRNNVIVMKSDKHDLGHVIKGNLNDHKLCRCPSHDVRKWSFTSVIFYPQSHKLV